MIEPKVSPGPRSLSLNYEPVGITVNCRRLREANDTINGELEIIGQPPLPRHIHIPSSFNFTASRTRAILAKELAEKINSTNWLELLEAVSQRVIIYVRQGDEVETWQTYEDAAPPRWLCEPLLPDGQFSIIFGEGGSGKSKLALLVTLLVSYPYDDNPYGLQVHEAAPGLYLDWESSSKQVRYDVRCILRGAALDDCAFNYLHLSRPLADSLDQVEAAISKLKGVGFIILDSLGAAAGGDLNSTEPAFRLIAAVRELTKTGIAVLAIGHTAKNQEGKKSVYGNVYYTNEARSIWELRRAEADLPGVVEVGLYHRKSNISAYYPQMEFKLTFGPGKNTFERVKAGSIPDLVDQSKLTTQILALWRTQPRTTVNELVKLTGRKGTVVSSTLHRLKGQGRAFLYPDKTWGRPSMDVP